MDTVVKVSVFILSFIVLSLLLQAGQASLDRTRESYDLPLYDQKDAKVDIPVTCYPTLTI